MDHEFDYIAVLGSNGDINSPVTIDRIQNALEAAEKWPRAKLVLTGNESNGEVTAFKVLLNKGGISQERIIEETKSQDTWDNISHTKALIPNGSRLLVVTSMYHQRRALAMARAQKIRASAW